MKGFHINKKYSPKRNLPKTLGTLNAGIFSHVPRNISSVVLQWFLSEQATNSNIFSFHIVLLISMNVTRVWRILEVLDIFELNESEVFQFSPMMTGVWRGCRVALEVACCRQSSFNRLDCYFLNLGWTEKSYTIWPLFLYNFHCYTHCTKGKVEK